MAESCGSVKAGVCWMSWNRHVANDLVPEQDGLRDGCHERSVV
jgi:ketol-acid reductoisomerase